MAWLSDYIAANNGEEPAIIETTVENPQVEPLHGIVTVDDIFDRFPETVYNKSKDSALYQFMTALCGDAGVGRLKKQTYNARLLNEGEYLTFQDLDTFATVQFLFKRLPSELYTFDTGSEALTPEEWRTITNQDSHFKHRLQEFFKATRWGTSPLGMKYAAQAGSGIESEVIENYKHIFDQYSDDPLGLEAFGWTSSVDEFIISAHLEETDGSIIEQTADKWTASTDYNIGDLVRPTTYANGATGFIYTVMVKGTSGVSEPIWPQSGTVVDNTVTWEQTAIDFTPAYLPAFQQVPDFIAPVPTGLSRPIAFTRYDANYVWDTSGTIKRMSPGLEHNMIEILDRLRPQGALMTTLAQSKRHIPIVLEDLSPFATSERIHVNRFVNGRPEVSWPDTDKTLSTFIVGGEESEAIHQINNAREIPVIFQTIEGIAAYNDRALDDPHYNDEQFFAQDTKGNSNYRKYISYHTGIFFKVISSIYTFFKTSPKDLEYKPERAVATHNTPLTMEGKGR